MPPKKTSPPSKATKSDESIGGFGVMDLLRILGGLAVASAGISYMVTGGSYTWGYSVSTALAQLKGAVSGPINLTDAELKAFDGSDPNKPVYVALAGIIYDVSEGRGVYGPGGSYNKLAGRDATRAFITGCFDTDLHADVRGAEDLYMPVTPAEAQADGRQVEDKYWKALEGAKEPSSGEKKIRRQQELKSAKKTVDMVVDNWAVMFNGGRGKNYFKVGEVKREEGWMDKLPKPPLCKDAQIRRPIRMGL